MFEFSILQWALIVFCAIIIGASKAGIPGISLVAIPLLAYIFGGKMSTGFLLPILIFADIFAARYYYLNAKYKYLFRVLPGLIIGIFLAVWVGQISSESVFKALISTVVFVCIFLMLYNEKSNKSNYKESLWFATGIGVIAGFATMIGNAAGPIVATYMLTTKLDKLHFISTSVMIFLIVNLIKFPLHIFIWETITFDSLLLNILLLPVIALGSYIGVHIVKKISSEVFRIVTIIVTVISALLLLI